MKCSEIESWLWDQAAAAAREWYRLQVADSYARVYLYHREADTGGLCVGSIKGPSIADGWKLSYPERIPVGQTIEQATRWIVERSRRLPCLPREVAQ